ncbi:MAG: pyridoxal phosphate-dependent aminotransferase [Paracoccaceae bacterium]|nr:pyridoxal phosphate-dependent aminotransferase [Paracoccaceae bacterium]
MNFDEKIERRGTHSVKWDMMEHNYGVSPDNGIPMWVADMDFHPPECVQKAVQNLSEHGIYGYYGDDTTYKESIKWWMKNRHNWELDTEWIFSTHGLVNGAALCIETFSEPGDRVILFTPVYHSFFKVIKAASRKILECPLVNNKGRYEFDFPSYDKLMTGKEKIVILCSPHNPGGRVWTEQELKEVADFAQRHDLILISDEIHHDIVYPGANHVPMTSVGENIYDRLVMMTATTKTFNIAGAHTGNVIIPDEKLRKEFKLKMAALGISPNSFGLFMAKAAYSPEGAVWVDNLIKYLDGNRQIFDNAISKIPGLDTMKLEGTYLAWVDFSKTGMEQQEFIDRVQKTAKIAASQGWTFGENGSSFLRFNFATTTENVKIAVERLCNAFSDLQ